MLDVVVITESWVQAPNVCRFFLNGNCRYGNFCRNSHVIASEENDSPESIVQAEHDVTNNNEYDGSNYTQSNEVTRNWIDAPEFIPRYQNANQTSNEDDGQGASRFVVHRHLFLVCIFFFNSQTS